jgi:urease subunit beta
METGSGEVPGEIRYAAGDIELNPGRPVVTVRVENTGDRPVQVGSHLHFAEANEALAFDREAAWGHRLGVPAGTSIRFEPGLAQQVDLVAIAGSRVVHGIRGLSGGALDSKAGE